MPSREVQFYPGEFYHIYNRGNAKQDIFYNDRDRYRFLQAMYLSNNSDCSVRLMELEKNKSGYTLADIKKVFNEGKISYNPLVRISADVLMPNHFHLLIEELQEKGISRFMQRLGDSYGKYFTIKYDRPGSLFQGRFKAVHIKNDDQLRYLLAYINAINPAQLIEPKIKEKGIEDFQKILEGINKYSWGTHFEYMGKRESAIIDKGLLGKIFSTPEIYYEFIKEILHGKEDMWSPIEGLMLD
ncbi:transposase [Patescibacteria group bacterium]|nr:transposase [Patescibacteria group bacterium]